MTNTLACGSSIFITCSAPFRDSLVNLRSPYEDTISDKDTQTGVAYANEQREVIEYSNNALDEDTNNDSLSQFPFDENAAVFHGAAQYSTILAGVH